MNRATPREIERSYPLGLHAIIGNERLVAALLERLKDPSAAANVLVSGPPGTGKSSCLKAFGRALCCRDPDLAKGCGCGVCYACRAYDCRDTERHTGLLDDRTRRVLWAPIDGARVTRAEIEDVAADYRSGYDEVVIWIDECHRLGKELYGRLLKLMEDDPSACFVATTTDPEVLPGNFGRRFSERLATSLPSVASLSQWITQRCGDWGIEIDTPRSAQLLAQRSHRNVAACQATIAAAAASPERSLTDRLVRSRQPFFDGLASSGGSDGFAASLEDSGRAPV